MHTPLCLLQINFEFCDGKVPIGIHSLRWGLFKLYLVTCWERILLFVYSLCRHTLHRDNCNQQSSRFSTCKLFSGRQSYKGLRLPLFKDWCHWDFYLLLFQPIMMLGLVWHCLKHMQSQKHYLRPAAEQRLPNPSLATACSTFFLFFPKILIIDTDHWQSLRQYWWMASASCIAG